jgi:hypothetical protein
MLRNSNTFGPASRRISATCVHTAVLNEVSTLNFHIPTLSAVIHRSAGSSSQKSTKMIQAYLHQNIKKREWRRPHKRYELRGGGNYERSGRLNGGMHARCLGLGAKRRIRRWEGEGVGGHDLFDLLNRRLYNVGKGFQFGKGIAMKLSNTRPRPSKVCV